MAAPALTKWKVLAHKWVTHDVYEIKLQRPAGMEFIAGQYISIVVPGAGPGGRNLRRAYSIASSPENPEIELCIKKVEGGPGSTYLSNVKVGDEVEGQAPFGHFILDHDMSAPTLFIGTGTGIAPHRSMILTKKWQPKAPVGFILGVRDQRDILYPELFPEMKEFNHKEFAGNPHVKICLSRPSGEWNGFKGRVTDYLRMMVAETNWDFARTHVYLCGSGDMIAEIKDILMNQKGLPKEQIHNEKYY